MDHEQYQDLFRAEVACSWWRQGEWLNRERAVLVIQRLSERFRVDAPAVWFTRGDIAYGRPRSVLLPVFARNVPFICHEFAHVVHHARGGDGWHTPEFAGVELDVVEAQLGDTAAAELAAWFSYHQVKIR